MKAISAAKRPLWVLLSVALLIAAAAHAKEAEKSGYLGVMLQDLTPSMAKALQLGDESGVLVNDVVAESPAAKAGLEDGDIILQFNGAPTADPSALTRAVRQTSPGDMVQVVVLRGGKKKTLDVEIGEREQKDVMIFSDKDATAPGLEFYDKKGNRVLMMDDDGHVGSWTMKDGDFDVKTMKFFGDRGFLGVHLDDLTGQLGEYFGVADGEGALVTEVIEDSPAAAAGLMAGDVIVKVGDEKVDSSAALHEAMIGTEADQEVTIEVVRKGKSKSFKVTLGEMPEEVFAQQMKIITDDGDFTWHAPRMMKHHFIHPDHDVDVRIIRRGDPHAEMELQELQMEKQELKEMRDELDQMRQELDKMRQELKK